MEAVTDVSNLKFSLLVTTIALWLYWLWQRRHLYWFALKFPGEWGAPFIGGFYKATFQLANLSNVLPLLKKQFESFNTSCLWLGPHLTVLTQEPEFIEKVLSSPDLLNKAKTFYDPFFKIFGGGVTASPADKWSHNRKLLNPSFNHKVLLSFFPIFHKGKMFTLSKFDALVGKGEHKLLNLLQRITLGVSVETTMGKVLKGNEKLNEDLITTFQYLLKHSMIQVILAMLNLDIIYRLNYRFWKAKHQMRNYTTELIEQKIRNQQLTNKDTRNGATSLNKETDISIKKAPNIFIDQAIQLYETGQFTWHDMQCEANTILVASFETTANTTFAVLVMLAMHPEVQEKLYQEFVSVFPDKDFEMEYSHIEQLPYLDMVINEVMRLHPAVPLIGRQVVKDTQLTKDILLPKDLQIVISIFHLHRRTDIWGPNAEKFNPDHFLPENIKNIHPFAYIPFSKGNRNCIGWRYAIFSLKIMLAGYVRNYRFTTTFKYDDLRFVNKVVLFYLDEPGIEIQRR